MTQYNLCVSLGNIELVKIKEAISKHEFVEFRLDLLERNEKLFEAISLAKKSIVAFHKSPLHGGFYERSEALIKAIESGASYIDLDVEDEMVDVEEKAKKHFTKVIRSYHNHNETPNELELEKIIFHAKRNADLVKIATTINSYDDALLLLNLLKIHKDLIVVGMGEKGSIVRVLSPLLGGAWTYASLTEGFETAPGQLSAEIMSRFQSLLDSGDSE